MEATQQEKQVQWSWFGVGGRAEVGMEQNPGGRVRSQGPQPPMSRSSPDFSELPAGGQPRWSRVALGWGVFFAPGPCSGADTDGKRETDSDLRQDRLRGARLLATEF